MSASRPRPRRTAVLVALGAAAVDAAAVAVFWRVQEARRALLSAVGGSGEGPALRDFDPFEAQARSLVLGDGDEKIAFHAFAALQAEARTLAIGGALLGVLALSATLFALFRAPRRGALATFAVAAPAAILGVAGVATLLGARASLRHVALCVNAEALSLERYRDDVVAAHAASAQIARVIILVVALLVTLAIVTMDSAVATPQPRTRRLLIPGALFAAGLAAFVLTRTQAVDLWAPMPLMSTRDRLSLPAAQAAALPPAYRCDPLHLVAPVVALGAPALSLDGIAAADQTELVRKLVARRELWQQVQPNHPFRGVVQVAIPANTKLATALPLIAALREAGYPIVDVLEVRAPRGGASRPLGEAAYLPRGCAVRIDANRELPPAATWGEMARALVSGI